MKSKNSGQLKLIIKRLICGVVWWCGVLHCIGLDCIGLHWIHNDSLVCMQGIYTTQWYSLTPTSKWPATMMPRIMWWQRW
jgi:hypothetical protein